MRQASGTGILDIWVGETPFGGLEREHQEQDVRVEDDLTVARGHATTRDRRDLIAVGGRRQILQPQAQAPDEQGLASRHQGAFHPDLAAGIVQPVTVAPHDGQLESHGRERIRQ